MCAGTELETGTGTQHVRCLRCVGFIISLSARDASDAVRVGGERAGTGCLLSIFRAGNKPPEKSIGKQAKQRVCQHPSLSLSLSILIVCAFSRSLWPCSLGWFWCKLFQPPNKVIPVLRRTASDSPCSPRGLRVCLCPPRPGACAPRTVVYLFAVAIALWMLLPALSLSLSLWLPAGTPVREACALPGAQRCRERACSALRSGVTLSWHRHRQPQRQRPQRLHMKTRALLALIRLGPGGVDAATATSPHRELRVLPCQEVRFVFIVLVLLRCARASVPFVYPSICPSVRASICPPLVVSKRRVLVFTICRCWSQSRCHHNKTAPTSTPSPTTSNQLRHGTG